MEENAGLHAQLVAQAREAGIFDERQRMAGEIHDTLAQGLTGIVAQLEAAELAEDDAPRRRRHLNLAKDLARDSLAEARRSVQALRPQKLEGARLPEALRELSEQWTQTSGIPVRVEVDGEASPLQPALEVVLFRAAQEALANIAKHSKATRAGLTLSYMHDQVSLDVLDDGKGFDPNCPRAEVSALALASASDEVEPQNANGTGYGLAAMRRRLRQVGGGLEIESAPGDGTTVSASVPALYRRHGRIGRGEEHAVTNDTDAGRRIRLLIVDDHPIVRDGLRAVFESEAAFEVVGQATDGAEAVERAAALGVDVVLMDLRMPRMGGVEAIRKLRETAPDIRVLVLTTFDSDTDVLPAVEAGATGYLLKDAPRDELLRAVHAAYLGQAVLAPSVAQKLLGRVRTPTVPVEQLTERELKVLTLVASGTTNREAAKQLFISEATVKTHLLHTYAKLGVRDRAAAVAEAYKRGLLG
jgi:DNA-binding NarL/FixJ family response regulator/two-component sensor histidine kinase